MLPQNVIAVKVSYADINEGFKKAEAEARKRGLKIKYCVFLWDDEKSELTIHYHLESTNKKEE